MDLKCVINIQKYENYKYQQSFTELKLYLWNEIEM